MEFFTEFARTGNPNSMITRELVQWDPVSKDVNLLNLQCLNLSNELKVETYAELNRVHIWEQLYLQETVDLAQH